MTYVTSVYKWTRTSTEGKSKHPFCTPLLNWSVFLLNYELYGWCGEREKLVLGLRAST